MKFNKKVTSSLKKARKQFFEAKGVKLTKQISSKLSKELMEKYENKLKRFPVRKNDTVIIKTGEYKNREGKITKVNRFSRKINIEGVDRQENDKVIHIDIDPSNCRIVSFGTEFDRMKMVQKKLERIDAAFDSKNKLVE